MNTLNESTRAPLETFLRDFVDQCGGVWDEIEPQVYDVLLPSEAASGELDSGDREILRITYALIRIVDHCEEGGFEGGITRLVGQDGGLRSFLWWSFWEHIRRLPLSRAKAMPAFMFCTAAAFDEFHPFDEEVAIGEEWPILADLFQSRPRCFVYDRSISARTSNRRMEQQPFGYVRTFLKYIWAILHRSGRLHYTDQIR